MSVASFNGIVESKLLARGFLVLPFLLIGIHIGVKYFNPNKEEQYKKFVLGLLVFITFILLGKVWLNG